MESTGKEATRVVLSFLVSARHLERRFVAVKNVTVATRPKKKIKAHQNASGPPEAIKVGRRCAPHIPAQWMKQAI